MSARSIRELVRPDRVHSDLYTDQQIFDQEIERIYHQGWVFIGHVGEIPNPGDFRQRQIGFKPVIFVRDDKGDRCSHRGNAICHLERGNARAFQCAYHGWRFKLDGQLAVVPFRDRYDDTFDPLQLNLRRPAQVGQHRGFVFATLNPDAGSFEDYLGPLAMRELDDIADLSPEGELLVTAGTHNQTYAGNWKLQFENAIDGYHANITHRTHFDTVRFRTGFDPSPLTSSTAPAKVYSLGNGHSAWDSSSINKVGSRNFPGQTPDADAWAEYYDKMVKAHGQERTDYLLSKQGSHVVIFPNFSYTGSHFRLFQPIGPGRTNLILFPFLLKGAPDDVNRRRLRVHEVFYGPAGGGQSDDLEIFERNQIGLKADVNPWSLLLRGLHLEEREPDGAISNQITDELSNRAMWSRWAELMDEENEGVPAE
jgi:phenylpropionate dioxygenase-like ring-hydroxylating dioxygenase large terminal subunit